MVWVMLVLICFAAMLFNQAWLQYNVGDTILDWRDQEGSDRMAYWLLFINVSVHVLSFLGIVIALIKIIG